MSEHKIEFICEEKHYGEVAEPKPASHYVPDWYSEVSDFGNYEDGLKNVTDCIPFAEAMTVGWIIPIPVTFGVEVNEKATDYTVHNDYNMSVMGHMPKAMLGGLVDDMGTGFVAKLKSPWRVRVDDGVSLLCVHPMNRHNGRFHCFSGIIDIDDYQGKLSAQTWWYQTPFDGELEKGMPMMQVIPFDRDGLVTDSNIRQETNVEHASFLDWHSSLRTEERFYRENNWKQIPKAKMDEKTEEDKEDDV